MARTITYKGHQIRAHAVLVTDSEEGEWVSHAVVRVPVPNGHRDQMGWVDRHSV